MRAVADLSIATPGADDRVLLDLPQRARMEARVMLNLWVLVAGLGGCPMWVRYGLIGFAAAILVAASLVPDDAFARRAGGFQGGRGYRVAGGPRPSHPIAGRPIAGRPGAPGRPIAGYPGGYPGYGWRGAAYGAAAVGAAAAGAYGLYGYYNNYNNGCYQDTYGNWVCPGQYQYYR